MFTQELFDAICDRIANGESLRAICAEKQMPSQVTVFKWVGDSPDLAKQYARAREAQAERLADEIVGIADAAQPDTANVARLQIDARKWVASKLRPKVYGDRVAIGGSADMDPIKTEEVGGAAKLEAFLNAVSGRADRGASE